MISSLPLETEFVVTLQCQPAQLGHCLMEDHAMKERKANSKKGTWKCKGSYCLVRDPSSRRRKKPRICKLSPIGFFSVKGRLVYEAFLDLSLDSGDAEAT